MTQFRGPALISAIVLVAFVWGYKKDVLHGAFASRSNAPASDIAPPQAKLPQVAPAAAPSVAKRPDMPTMAKPFPPTQFPPPQGQRAKPAPPYTPPANPYADLAAKYGRKNTSMAKTFDSIRRNSVDQKQVIQKNAYFRKLSEQLKQLRGEDQPGATAAPNTNTPAGSAKNSPPKALPEQNEKANSAMPTTETQAAVGQMDLDDTQDEISEEEVLADELDRLLEDEDSDAENPPIE